MLPFDLHVLGLPPAFNLSHDQTLRKLKILIFCVPSAFAFYTSFFCPSSEGPHRLSVLIFKDLFKRLVYFVLSCVTTETHSNDFLIYVK